MFLKMLIVMLLLFLVQAVSCDGNERHLVKKRTTHRQTLTCYDYYNGGDSVVATDYIEDLRKYNMYNRISYCCFTGIWVLYSDVEYNAGDVNGASWWAYGDNYCTPVPPLFDNAAKSLRFTGAPDDMRYDTLNLYFEENFIGMEEFMYHDKPALNYDNRAKSIIVTGCGPWTIYQYDNYRGLSACVFPGDITKCDPGFYPTSQHLGELFLQVSSAKRGCHSNTQLSQNLTPIFTPRK